MKWVQQLETGANQDGHKIFKSTGMLRSRGKLANLMFVIPCNILLEFGKLSSVSDSVLI